MGRECSTNGGEQECIYVIGGKPDGKRPLGTLWHSWIDNIKMDLGEMGWGGMDWIDVAQDRDW
jgi:hypothetical protein